MDAEAKRRYRCPKCGREGSLYENVTVQGWRSIDATLEPVGPGHNDRDVEWDTAEPDAYADFEVGCSECEWQGARNKLEAIGIDGEPLPEVHADQLSLSDG